MCLPLSSFLAIGVLSAALPLAAQNCRISDDPAYDGAIKKNTTLVNFSTDLVDHLPMSSCVDAPDKFFGAISGAPDVLHHVAELNAYLRKLESQSKRVKVFSIGKSEEGREMVIVAISDEATIANIDQYRGITARLGDPRGLSDADAETLIKQGKPIYWAAGSIHSTETGSPEMLMELAYRLAVEETPFIQTIRKNTIVLITPATEVDGRDREVDLYMHRKKNPDAPTPSLIWWGHYVDHDNNRDGLTLALALSRNLMSAFLQWHATVLHDLHESEPYLYISTGTGPYNPWLDPMEIDEWQSMAAYEIDALTKRDVIGVWTHGFFDGWAPNYMLYVAIGHNAIGRFYETQGNGGADTRQITTGAADTSKQWYRPNPPLPTVLWSARDNVNMQESGLLFGMYNMATNSQDFLRDFYLKSKRAVAKAKTEGPAAWVFPGDDPRPGLQARLLDQIQLQGVEVHKASAEFTASGKKHPAGSYIIRMDEPYSREADMLLDTEYYNPSDPAPYDDTGWTMGALADVQTIRIADTAILNVPMTKVAAPVEPPNGVSGTGKVYLVNADADPNLASFRYKLAATPMQAAEDAFTEGGKHFNSGSFVISNANAGQVADAAKFAGVSVVSVDAAPTVPMHPIDAPRIGLMHNWQTTQQDGWYRIGMDQTKIPYTYIADTYVRQNADLRDKFDVIVMPPMGNNLSGILNGLAMRGQPIAWRNTADMPSLSPEGLDSSDDIRGGLGLAGIVNLEKFVSSGGLLIAVGPSMAVATDVGMTEGVTTRQAPTGAEGLVARGAVVRATLSDARSPIAYGYADADGSGDLGVYFSGGLLLTAGAGGGRGGFGGGGSGGRGGAAGGRNTRASGIGNLTTPDVVQARPPASELNRESQNGDGGEGSGENADNTENGGGRAGRGGAAGPAPRIILRFAGGGNLLISGLLTGGENIAGQPVVVDATHGQGHVLLFAGNPMWRNETSGEFSLMYNAMMNYKHLDAGAPAAGGSGRGGGRGRGRGGTQ